MALNFPQADLPSRLRGGADAWDDGVAGLILSEDFFASAITGTVYDVNCSEVTAVSESVGQSVSLTVLLPESATLADSTDRSAVFPAAGAEAAAAGDNVGGGILSELAASEGSAATDEASGGRVYTFMGEYAAESNLLIWEKGSGISVSTVSTPYGDGVRIQRVITGTYEYLQTPAIAKADFKFKIKPDPAANGTLFFPSTDSLNFSGGVITSGGGRVVVTPLDGGWYDVESTGEGWGAGNFCTIQILLQSSTNSLGRYIDIQGMEIFSPFGSARLTDSADYPIEHDEYIVDVENYTDPMTSYPAWGTYPGAIVVDQGWWLFKEDSNYNYHYADKATSARLVTDTFIVEFKFYGGATDRVLSFEHSSYAVYVLSDGTINLSYSWWDSAIEPTAEVLPDGWVRVVIATDGSLTLPEIWLNTADYEFEYAGDPTKGFYLRNLENCQNASTIGDTSVGGMLYEIRGMGDQSGELAPWNWASKTSLTLTYPISAPYPNAFRLSVNSGAFVPNLLQSGFARGERYGSYKYYADGIGAVGMWFTVGSYTVTIIPFYDGSVTASLAGSAYQVDLGNGWREVFFRTGSIPGNASTVSISFRPLQVTGPTTNTTVFSKAVVVDVADFQIFGSEGAAAGDTQSQSTLLGGAYDEGVWRDTSNSLLDVIKSFSNVDVLSHTDNSLVLREQAGVTGFKAQSVNLRVSALISGNCYVDVKPGTGRGVVLSVYLVGVVNPMKLYVMPGPVINISSLIDSASYVDLGGGYYRVRFFPLVGGFLVTSVVVEVAKDLGSGSSTTSYTGEAGAASVEIANLDLFVKHISVDTSDSTVTTGSTNINESQTDAANSLDASTTLMLSLLAEYATGNAIDLPISQYVVLNDTTEAGTNSDTQNGSLLAQSAGSESSPADATHNTTLSTSGAGVEAGTATDTSGTQQTTSVVGTAPTPASDTPVSSAVLQSSETEVASGQDTVLGNYLTSSTGVATGSADNTQGNTLSATASGTGDGAAQETSSTDQGIDTLSQNPSPATDTPVSTALLLSSEVEVASGQDEAAGTYLTSSTSTAASFADSAQSNAMSTGAAGVETSASTVSQSAQGVALPVSTEAATAADVPASTQVSVVVGVGAGVALDTTTSSATMYASDSESVTATELIDWSLFSTHFASRTEAVSAVDVPVATSAYALSELVNLSPVDIIIAAQTTTSSATELSAATSFQTTDSLVFVSQQDMGVAAEIAQNWITAYLEHAESVLATEWSAGTMLTNQQTLETLAAQEIQTGSMLADSTVAESSPAVDSALAGFTLAATLAATASGSEILTAQNVGALAVASEAGVAGDSTTTQLTHLAVAVEAAFSADIGGATAIFIVGHSVQAFGQEVVDGVTAQFSSISEVVAALEALIVEAFGPSKLTPELTRVLLQVATTSVLMRADRIEVLREELRTVVETGVEKTGVLLDTDSDPVVLAPIHSDVI